MIASDAKLRNHFVRISIIFFHVVRNYTELWISLAFIASKIAVLLQDAEKSEAHVSKSDSNKFFKYRLT